jgi:hypothetical protein
MARELSVTFGVDYEDTTLDVLGDFDVTNTVSLVTTKLLKTVQSIATSETALELGDISSRGFCIIANLDPTNYVEVKVGTAGAIFAKLFPKDSTSGINWCCVHLGSGAQSPYAIANSSACKVMIFLCPL